MSPGTVEGFFVARQRDNNTAVRGHDGKVAVTGSDKALHGLHARVGYGRDGGRVIAARSERVARSNCTTTSEVAMRWDPGQYKRFADERARPFRDLLARVHASDASAVADLGCGPGTLTLELARRWPEAAVEGIDSSPEMVSRAQSLDRPQQVRFREQDLREWRPEQPVDVIVSNATLQWVPGHLDLLPTLVEALSPGGWLAFQVPGNFAEPSHQELVRLRTSPRWRARLGADAERTASVHEPQTYLDRLLATGCAADVWETTYLHVLAGPDAVVEWMKGTGLRPVLSALEEDERATFLEEYALAVRPAYPARELGGGELGTVLPFRRIFAVAKKRGDGERPRAG